MSNIEHSSSDETLQSLGMKARELTAKQILSVPCPTCGAATGDACALHTGALRTEPHRDRKLSAAEAAEMKAPKRRQPAKAIAEDPDKHPSVQASNFDQTSEGTG